MKLFTFQKRLSEAVKAKESDGCKVECSVEGSKYVAKVSDGTKIVGDLANLTITVIKAPLDQGSCRA